MPNITPEQVLAVREGYAAGKTIKALIAETGVRRHAIYPCIHGNRAGPDGELAPLPLRVPRRLPQSHASRKTLVNRLWRMADAQVRDIEERLRLNAQPGEERERDARLLSTMVKTLRELRALDAQKTGQEPHSQDEQAPRNLDDFRKELARKIDGIVARRGRDTAGNVES